MTDKYQLGLMVCFVVILAWSAYIRVAPFSLISSCLTIDKPGHYDVSADIHGAVVPISGILNETFLSCIDVSASDVYLDCGNHTLHNDKDSNRTIGISVMRRSNVTISNCVIIGYHNGIYLMDGSDGNTVFNNTVINSQHDGIGLLLNSDNTVSGNTVSFSGDQGIGISYGDGHRIFNNSLQFNPCGIDCSPCDRTAIYDNEVRYNAAGLCLAGGIDADYIGNNTMGNNGVAIQRGED